MGSAGGEYPLRLTTFASSPKGTPLRCAGNFAATAKRRPLGGAGTAKPCLRGQNAVNLQKKLQFFLEKGRFPIDSLVIIEV